MREDQDDPFEPYSDNLELLAEKISDVLGRPVTIEDASHRLVAYSSHVPETDAARLATIVGRRVPDQIIGSLWRDGVIPRLLESETPIRIAPIQEVGLNGRVATAIRSGSRVVGFIWVLETEKPFSEREMALFAQAAQAARTKMAQWQLQRHKEEEAHRDFFWQLLTGHLSHESLIRDKAHRIGITLPPQFHVVVLQFATEVKEALQRQTLEKCAPLSAYSRIVLRAIDKNQLILLFAPLAPDTMDGVANQLGLLQRNLLSFFSAQFLGLASGGTFSEYGRLEDSYREALLLLQVKRRFPEETGDLVMYGDLGYYRYLPRIWEELQKHGRAGGQLARLQAYDQEHHSELAHTLEVFLTHDSNAKIAADALHIHANTLNYRLKRIAEIGRIDLSSMEQKVTLYLELKAERFGGSRDL
ncbi:helix-turn-helix domain-containing protein [Paenibacillus sp. MBLB2552]|uniref:Helix-turn-helix domain-containing protein n=1 Tax=Paenibacillus mellifer TaxID=2937794 RepID=A0A9X1XUK8_9BACL|nr:helix-turn-helix domain-containing protein [Paenibacillus mellifer]MCK8485624.1 helix-turn-helix domain-containing protein [Paenibacillus mellifer]